MIQIWLNALLNWCFPPLCIVCETPCTTKLFCLSCWELCRPVDPKERCVHCFQELDVPIVCSVCRKSPSLPIPSAFIFEATIQAKLFCRQIDDAPEAIAGFFVFQWTELNWPIPDAILPLDSFFSIAKTMALWLDSIAIRHWKKSLSSIEALGEGKTFLILGKKQCIAEMREYLAFLSRASPKKIYLLTLVDHDHRIPPFNSSSHRERNALLGDAYCPAATSLDCPETWQI